MTITHPLRRSAALTSTLAALAVLGLGSASPAGAAAAPARPCSSAVTKTVVPTWARAGFSDPKPTMPQALGRQGRIDAIVFGDPLHAPPSKRINNKILWVSRLPVGEIATLRIAAQRMVGTRSVGVPVSRSVAGGPGPSIIDLPAAGCWRLSLRWSGHTDSVDLAYRGGTS
jgi:hypothetical protein